MSPADGKKDGKHLGHMMAEAFANVALEKMDLTLTGATVEGSPEFVATGFVALVVLGDVGVEPVQRFFEAFVDRIRKHERARIRGAEVAAAIPPPEGA